MEKLEIPKEDAKISADVLIAADLSGIDSHGLIRIYSYYGSRLEKKYMDPSTPFKVISETDTTVLYNGGNGLGQVVSCLTMKKCIEKAKRSNVASTPSMNSCQVNHF